MTCHWYNNHNKSGDQDYEKVMDKYDFQAYSDFVGIWEDDDTKTRHLVWIKDGEPTVIASLSSSGEEYEVKRSYWSDGVLEWSYYVPSTGYTVKLESTLALGTKMWCNWDNSENSGEQAFTRVSNMKED
jgi:hypothetical protein